jgi:SecD/SecF fusion protein
LIFERIKEEKRSGKSVASAITAGFQRAFTTIIDTHVTTVVASAFLFVFGTGPVRGFAVTLVIGLVANLFTAVFVSRAIFDVQLWRKPKLEEISIGKELFKTTNIDFLSKRALTLGLSILAIVVSIVSLVAKGGPNYGLDFRGGTLMYVRFDPKPPIDDLRSALAAKLGSDFSLQETQGTGEFIIGTALADEQSLEQSRLAIEQTLKEKYGQSGTKVDIRSVEIVGPRAGEQLRRQGLYATLGALGGMLIYIAFRFKLVSGAAAVIATIHDVVITLGLFSLTNREIDLTIVAALLTLIGYSMNDKIVVFDRVRENEQKGSKKRGDSASFLDLVNQSINQTLSRTLLTAGPTLLACMALYFLGGDVLNGIAFALFIGIIVGTYSSIFVASALLVMWRQRQPAMEARKA